MSTEISKRSRVKWLIIVSDELDWQLYIVRGGPGGGGREEQYRLSSKTCGERCALVPPQGQISS